jgi:hypothetical protein
MRRSWRKLVSVASVAGAIVVVMSIAAPAIAAFTNPGNPSGNGVAPTVVNGFPNCPSGQETHNWTGTGAGTQNLAAGGSITVTKPTSPSPGPGNASRYFNFSATGAKVNTVFVKTDVFVIGFITESNRYTYGAALNGAASDTKLHSPTNASKQPYVLSAIRFCYTPVTYKIKGTAFYDWNLNGSLNAGDTGVAGVVVTATGPVTKNGTSIAGGTYEVASLKAGTYNVCQQVLSGWTASTGCQTVTVPQNPNPPGDATGVNFGSFKLVTLSGVKYNDHNLNGEMDGGDEALEGFTINVAPTFSPPAGAVNIGGAVITAADGTWSSEVHAGSYTVSESAMPAGTGFVWVQSPGTPNKAAFNYQANTADLNFGNYKRVTLSGLVFHDVINNGERDAGEEGLSGSDWRVNVEGLPEDWTGATFVDPDGNGDYSIDLPAGQLSLCLSIPSLPNVGDATQSWLVEPDLNSCSSGTGRSADYQVDTPDLDFSAVNALSFPEGGGSATVGDEGEPQATVTIGANCTSTQLIYDSATNVGGFNQVVMSADVNPNSLCVVEEHIEWAPEPAVYVEGVLQLPPTLVKLQQGGEFIPVQFCEGNPPNPHCLVDRTIGQQSQDTISVVENYLFRGDPPKARN